MARDWTVVRVEAIHVDEHTVLREAWREAEAPVEEAVNKLIGRCAQREGSRFCDAGFGPSEKDEHGARAMYATGKPPRANYVDPGLVDWVRPRYAERVRTLEEECKEDGTEEDEEDEEDEGQGKAALDDSFAKEAEIPEACFCDAGCLWEDGVNANDVVQGTLGNCWLISAMAVLATRADLLERVFWRCSDKEMERNMRKYGFRVCRFFKDSAWFYVIIDDQLPVLAKSNKPVFAHSADPNELWVPFLEKAYAKLHGCYEALLGGYVDGGLRDLTGLACQEIVLREGHVGFHPHNKTMLENGRLFAGLDEYLNKWGCMAGCSIQPDPGKNKSAEADFGETGLFLKHAYSLIDVGVIKTASGPVKLVRLRNPWGRGEWKGAWSDASPEFAAHKDQLNREFTRPLSSRKGDVVSAVQRVEANDRDGTFFMTWEDWAAHFTVLFAAIDFPTHWSGHRVCGTWDSASAGGNNTLKTWSCNPAHRFRILEDDTRLFVSLCQDDPRLTKGRQTIKFQDPISFHIARDPDGAALEQHPPKDVPGSADNATSAAIQQAVYKLHLSNDLDIPRMRKGDYVAVPSTFYAQRTGPYFLHLYSDKPIAVDGGFLIAEEEEDDGKFVKVDFDESRKPAAPSSTHVQWAERFEGFKAQLVAQLAASGHNLKDLHQAFRDTNIISWPQWKETLAQFGARADRAAFEVFSGEEDNDLDQKELAFLAEGHSEATRIFGPASSGPGGDESAPLEDEDEEGAGDEAAPPASSSSAALRRGSRRPSAVAAHDATSRQAAELLGQAVHDLQEENAMLYDEVLSMRQEQARMLHLLMLYGRMLKIYNGPKLEEDQLVKEMPPRREPRVRLPDDLKLLLEKAPPAIPTRPPRRRSSNKAASQLAFMGDDNGDEFLAVKPWKGAICAPSNPPKAPSLKSAALELAWVYGHSGVRDAIAVNSKGQAVYFAAAVGVVLDPDAGTQTFFKSHTDDIVSFSTHGGLVVTGQMGKKPFACLWDATTGQLVRRLDAYQHARAVAKVCFSQDGSQVLTVGGDDSHTVVIYDAKSGKPVGKPVKGDKNAQLFAAHTGKRFVTGGVRNIAFWAPEGGTKKKGKFGKLGGGSPQTLPCAASISASPDHELLATGVATGQVFLWDNDGRVCHATDAPASGAAPVDAIMFDVASGKLVTGDANGQVTTWTVDLAAKTLSRGSVVSCGAPVRGICASYLALGNGDMVRREDPSAKVMAGHEQGRTLSNEVWGLTALGDTECASVGDDGVLHVWDTSKRTELRRTKLDGQRRALCASADGKTLAAGGPGNVVELIDAETLQVRASTTLAAGGRPKAPTGKGVKRRAGDKAKSAPEVYCIGFSPDGTRLAVGSNDGKVYVLDAQTLKPKRKRPYARSTSAVMHLDWSADSKYLRTNDRSYELIFYDEKDQVTSASSIKDVAWATANCSLSWETAGVFPAAADGTDINAATRVGADLLAAGDDNGQVKVMPFPFPEHDPAEVLLGKGHAAHVSNVIGLGPETVVSAGGRDCTVMQWSVRR